MDHFQVNREDFLVMVDKMSQYTLCKAVPNKKVATTLKVLREWACILGLPSVIKCDCCLAFKDGPFGGLCREFRINNVLTSAYHAESNGQIEHTVKE